MSGPDGRTFRTARKRHRCAHYALAERATNERVTAACRRFIEKGDRYLEGDMDPDSAGGFGHDRYCTGCVDADLT